MKSTTGLKTQKHGRGKMAYFNSKDGSKKKKENKTDCVEADMGCLGGR